ncbi:MAG: sugar ABC transporter substrate-binding protein [Methylobacteriaceae bacterium]|nr:sugar ABC transporter substrate-binding protein [Methylobacteriaceae bacterium]
MSDNKQLSRIVARICFAVVFSLAGIGAAFSQDAAAAVAAAQKEAEQALSAPTAWAGPTAAPKPLTGKKIAVISCAQLTEGCNRPSRAAVEAAQKLGWDATIFDGKGDVGTQLAAINAAVDSKYDGIALMIVDPVQVNEGIRRALDAKIPVVTLAEPAYTDQRKALLASVPDVSHDWLTTGKLIGDYMIWKSEGHINALLLNDPEVTVVQYGQFAGTQAKLIDKQACPDCKVTVENFTIATLNTQPAALTAAAVQRDPAINWVWCYDFCMANVATDLIARGLQGKIMGAGFDCNAQNLQLIRDGRVQVVCIADPRDWEAWAAVDTLNRLMNGQPAVDQNIPVRLFDKSNLDQLTDTDIKNGWQGGTDFRSQYLKIWGVR